MTTLKERERNEIYDKSVSIEKMLADTDIILIDTCSILHTGFFPFLMRSAEAFRWSHRKIYLLNATVRELEKLSLFGDEDLKERAARALDLLEKMSQYRILTVAGDADNPEINDAQLVEYALRFRMVKRLAVITQDYQLSRDLERINRLQSYYGNDVLLYKFNADNLLYKRIILF